MLFVGLAYAIPLGAIGFVCGMFDLWPSRHVVILTVVTIISTVLIVWKLDALLQAVTR